MKVRYTLFGLILWFCFAGMMQGPLVKRDCKGSVSDMVVYGNTVLLSTHNGWIQSFRAEDAKPISSFRLPQITINGNQKSDPFIYSFDQSPDAKRIVVASQGRSNFCNLYLYQNGKLSILLKDLDGKMLIKKIRFTDADKLLIATLSNELILYSLSQRKAVKTVHFGTSPFTDFAFNEDKSKFVSSDESGVLRIFQTQTLKLLKEIRNIHNDEVFQLAYCKGKIASASKDQSVAIVNERGSQLWKKQTGFFAYNVSLSKDASRLAYSASTQNTIEIVSHPAGSPIGSLQGHKAILTRMYFLNNSTLISAADDASLCIWKIN